MTIKISTIKATKGKLIVCKFANGYFLIQTMKEEKEKFFRQEIALSPEAARELKHYLNELI